MDIAEGFRESQRLKRPTTRIVLAHQSSHKAIKQHANVERIKLASPITLYKILVVAQLIELGRVHCRAHQNSEKCDQTICYKVLGLIPTVNSSFFVNSERPRFISFSGVALVCKLNAVIIAEDIEAMKKMNDFCTHNNITINENKSSYHWLRGEPGDIKTRGTDIRKEGADGLFTILG
ncbi:hypothetical protein PROFUN_14741 [Planoprotostelium fungivorum]|uniref:Uncharacterized protein n=1 Tax=Planoprotostelium fungivorum TaxID=1890364 RepID=A0A2P6MXZ9_9EUKA|nr:hypothetical protein PROFUN_14741 [Planoprotostelium fungivorum]